LTCFAIFAAAIKAHHGLWHKKMRLETLSALLDYIKTNLL
jgi:hypothetical protein